MRLAIYGTGGMGREAFGIARRQAAVLSAAQCQPWDRIVFIDDYASGEVCGSPVLKLTDLRAGDPFVLAIGSSAGRRKLEPMCLDRGLVPYSLEAPSHVRDDDVVVGDGALFSDFTAATAAGRIGRQFQCNLYAHVSHDAVIGDYVTLAPKACVNGHVLIEDDVWIGAGAIIKNGSPEKPLVIGKGATIGCGAVVVSDVPPGATMVGVPARRMP